MYTNKRTQQISINLDLLELLYQELIRCIFMFVDFHVQLRKLRPNPESQLICEVKGPNSESD